MCQAQITSLVCFAFSCLGHRVRKAVPLKEAGTARIKGEEMGQPPLSEVCLANLQNEGSCGIASSAAGEETIAATEEHELLNHLNNAPACRRALGMAVNKGRTIVIHLHDIIACFSGEGDVVDGKGIVGLDGFHIADFQACLWQGHFGGWDGRRGHEHGFDPRKTIGDDLYFDLWIRAQFFCLVPCGDDDSAVSVGREGLGAKTQDASGSYRFQPGQAFSGGRGPAFVLFDELGLLPCYRDFRGNI